MLLSEISKKYDMSEEQLKVLMEDKLKESFVQENLKGNDASYKLISAIDTLIKRMDEDEWKKYSSLIGTSQENTATDAYMAPPERESCDATNSVIDEENAGENENTNAEEGVEAITETTDVKEGEEAETEEVTEADIDKKARGKKKTEVMAELSSDIEHVPAVELRKFLANNFSVKPEKIFFMDDKGVMEKVNEKYIVIEKDDMYIFIKRSTPLVIISK